jgi:hypothetical protein
MNNEQLLHIVRTGLNIDTKMLWRCIDLLCAEKERREIRYPGQKNWIEKARRTTQPIDAAMDGKIGLDSGGR